MILKDLKSVWGIPVIHFSEYRKKYRLHSAIIALTDIVVMLLGTLLMFTLDVTFDKYGGFLISVCVVFHFFYDSVFKLDNWGACSFYYRNLNATISVEKYNLTDEILYSILYCSGYKKLHQGKTSDVYMDAMLSACCQDKKYSKSLAKNLEKYKDLSGNVSCYILTKGKKQYLVDFVSTDKKGD